MIYWLVNSVAILALAYMVLKTLPTAIPSWAFGTGLVLKLAAGLILGAIFFYQYQSGDTIAFYEAAKDLILEKNGAIRGILFEESAGSEFQDQPRVRSFVRILAISQLLSGGSYWLSALHFSLISFIAYWYFVTVFADLYPRYRNIVAVCFLFIPSIVFWSSGIIKDSIASAALVYLVAIVLKVSHHKKIGLIEMLFVLLGLILLLKVKHYLFIIFLIFVGLLACIMLFKKLKSYQKWIVSSLILFASLGLTQFVHPYLKIGRIPTTLFENNQAIVDRTDPEKRIGIELTDASWGSVLEQTPIAIYSGLFKPLLFDKTPLWGLIHKVENIILLSLTMLSILVSLKTKPKVNWTLVVPAIFCITLLVSMLALSTPNLGTLVRYKNACMPFFFLLASILPYQYLTSKRDG